MKKGLILVGLLFLYSCDVSESLEKVRSSVDGFFGEDKVSEKTVSLESIPSRTGNEESPDANKNLLITTNDGSLDKNVDVLDENKSEDEIDKDVISMTGDISRPKDTLDETRELDKPVRKAIESKTALNKPSNKSSSDLIEYVDIRPLLLKGQYEKAVHVEVSDNDSRNRYYRAIATYNVARKTGGDKYALLADKRFYELSSDKKMKNLRLRAVLWLGINGYSNLSDKKSLAEQIRPFDYLLKNYPTTRYANDATFYKMLVYMKAKEKDGALKMWRQLKNFKEDDLIYDVNHSEWVGQGKLLKRYGTFFESSVRVKSVKNSLKRVASAPSVRTQAVERTKKVNFELGELTKDEEERISQSKSSEVTQIKPNEVQNLKSSENDMNYSDDEASKKILGETRSDETGESALDAALEKDEKDLSKLETAKSVEPRTSNESIEKSVVSSSNGSKNVEKTATVEKEMGNAAKTAQAVESTEENKTPVNMNKSTASVDGMMKDMDNIISGY